MTKNNKYEMYRNTKTRKEYFDTWESSDIADLTEAMKDKAYLKYSVKSQIMQRDSFRCQNLDCPAPQSPLTWHHIKFRKNHGNHTVRNGVIICDSCHKAYHRARRAIRYSKSKHLPSHIRGHTIKLDVPDKVDWKIKQAKMKELRKELKQKYGKELTKMDWSLLAMILKFIFRPIDDKDD